MAGPYKYESRRNDFEWTSESSIANIWGVHSVQRGLLTFAVKLFLGICDEAEGDDQWPEMILHCTLQ
jgi:hypothetical protein